jgi:hypothetical protein
MKYMLFPLSRIESCKVGIAGRTKILVPQKNKSTDFSGIILRRERLSHKDFRFQALRRRYIDFR